ncbi:MAG: hypothetical protein ACNI3H_11875 [Halarcobacter ebronensis]
MACSIKFINVIHMSHSTEYILMAASIIVAVAGIFVAYKKYAKFDIYKPESEKGIIANKFFVDEFYDKIFVQASKKYQYFY